MRFALLALALLAPAAGAAAGPLAVDVVVAPFEGPVPVITAIAQTDVSATVSCALLANAAPGGPATLEFAVRESPAWTSTSISPARVQLPAPGACDANTQSAVARTKLFVGVDGRAPAFAPALIVVGAVLQGPAGKQEGEGNTTVEADWLSILDVDLGPGIAKVAPGKTASFKILATNRGNAPVDVLVGIDAVDRGWNVTVDSPRGVAPGESREVLVEATPPATASGTTILQLQAVARLASDPTRFGDSTRLALIVDVAGESAVDQVARGIPAFPGAFAALALVAGAVLARRVVK
ncbi:MAG TPA: hypothetical protein VM889_09200 [Candidatus Thermoplasmatota archaeon]|nr:hypothetical protein [Candidatus Thermoplasmatota archaeon]